MSLDIPSLLSPLRNSDGEQVEMYDSIFEEFHDTSKPVVPEKHVSTDDEERDTSKAKIESKAKSTSRRTTSSRFGKESSRNKKSKSMISKITTTLGTLGESTHSISSKKSIQYLGEFQSASSSFV